jgi:hypothetical protein
MYRFPSAQRQRRLEKCGIVANYNEPSRIMGFVYEHFM